MEKHYSMMDIQCSNKTHGNHFFDADTMRFFKSRINDTVYQGTGGVFFVTSERFSQDTKRHYTVREFTPETGSCETAGNMEFHGMTSYMAHKTAKRLAAG